MIWNYNWGTSSNRLSTSSVINILQSATAAAEDVAMTTASLQQKPLSAITD